MPIVLLAALLLAGCKGGGVIIPEETDAPEDTDTTDTDTDVADLDLDDDGFETPGDCDDANPDVHPGANETCNGLDDDCDDALDEEAIDAAMFYADVDGDGHGALSETMAACAAPFGYVSTSHDCDDSNDAVHPGADEICNALDDDCNAQIDEGLTTSVWYADVDGDGYGNVSSTMIYCAQPSGYVADATDCYDTDAEVYPGAEDWHTTPRSDGSFDHNCDKDDELRWTDWGYCYTGLAGWYPYGSPMPACGETSDWTDYVSWSSGSCPSGTPVYWSETQACR